LSPFFTASMSGVEASANAAGGSESGTRIALATKAGLKACSHVLKACSHGRGAAVRIRE
jgi:hypothetical protein